MYIWLGLPIPTKEHLFAFFVLFKESFLGLVFEGIKSLMPYLFFIYAASALKLELLWWKEKSHLPKGSKSCPSTIVPGQCSYAMTALWSFTDFSQRNYENAVSCLLFYSTLCPKVIDAIVSVSHWGSDTISFGSHLGGCICNIYCNISCEKLSSSFSL